MKNKFREHGIKIFEEHEILELILFYSITRTNTNNVAHLLIDEYGSLDDVFNGDCKAFSNVPGIGLKSELLLRFIGDILFRKDDYMNLDKAKKNNALPKRYQYIKYVKKDFENVTTAIKIIMIFVDFQNSYIGKELVYEGEWDEKEVIKRMIFTVAKNDTYRFITITHLQHPNSVLCDTEYLNKFVRKMVYQFRFVNISYLDFWIHGEQGLISLRKENEDLFANL